MYLNFESSNNKTKFQCFHSDCSTTINTTICNKGNLLQKKLIRNKRKRPNQSDLYEELSKDSTYSTREFQEYDNCNDLSFEEHNKTIIEKDHVNILKNELSSGYYFTFQSFDNTIV